MRLIKARWKWGETWGRRGRMHYNGGIGLRRAASLTLGAAHRATPAHYSASCTDCATVSTGEGGAV